MLFDTIIVGGGPAGLTCAIYLARANKKVLVIEKMAIGGQVAEIAEIENYPGFSSISGQDLSMNMYNQAVKFGVQFAFGEATNFVLEKDIKTLNIGTKIYEAKSIVFAIGSKARHIDVKNENEYIGKGVSYCATCDGNFFKGKNVAVVGSGDSAISNAQYLSSIANKVYILSKYENLHLINAQEKEIASLNNVEIMRAVKVVGIIGKEKVEGVQIEKDNSVKEIDIDALFVSIGRTPDTEFLIGKVDLDEKGYIKTNDNYETNLKGVFACGDIVSGTMKQIVTACSSGAIVSTSILRYIK
jgi:thioredoxin reductase (NADPH)